MTDMPVALLLLRFTLWSTLHILFKVRVIGADRIPRDRGALLVSNHVSYADAVIIGSATSRFIAFLLWKPIYESRFKPFFQMLKAIPISPTSPKESLASLAKARKELEAGQLVGIFPEGQITRTGHLLPFKRGFERIVEQKGADLLTADLIPVWLEGLWGHPLSMKGGKLFGSWRKVWRPQITLMIGEPIRHRMTPEKLHARVSSLASEAARLRDSGTLGRRFVGIARRHWSQLALADSTGQEFTFGRALTAALLIRKWLQREAPDQSIVGILLPNSSIAAVANLGVTLAGRTVVNLNFSAGEEAMSSAIGQCQIRTILTSRKFLEKAKLETRPGMVYLEELLPAFGTAAKLTALLSARLLPARWIVNTTQDDIAAVIFSSGSTGEPKGVELSHAAIIANIEGSAQIYNVDHRDAMLAVLPFFHSFGFTYSLWFPLLNEFKILLHHNPTDAKTIGELAEKYRATFLLSTPTFCTTYLRKCTREQLGHLRYVIVGAEKLRHSLAVEFFEKFGVTIFEGYGCTELGPVVAVNGPDFDQFPKQEGNRIGSVGRALPGVSLRVVDPETMQDVPHGQEGLLLVDSPSRMRGYLGQPERTAKVLYEGSYITGDIARIDDDGFLHITDRLSRFSKIGGEMVPHLKVEQALHSLTGDATVLVIGVPDDSRGERLVILHTAIHLESVQIIQHLQELPQLWIPKRTDIFLIEAIPTLGTGKTDLRRAREIAISLMNGS
jgi:acyl-[acyl-carrier-protein]-phospholipid O-acyltransferase/long-chain-fatty-acid--[acyl-carrier-protein] ligase